MFGKTSLDNRTNHFGKLNSIAHRTRSRTRSRIYVHGRFGIFGFICFHAIFIWMNVAIPWLTLTSLTVLGKPCAILFFLGLGYFRFCFPTTRTRPHSSQIFSPFTKANLYSMRMRKKVISFPLKTVLVTLLLLQIKAKRQNFIQFSVSDFLFVFVFIVYIIWFFLFMYVICSTSAQLAHPVRLRLRLHQIVFPFYKTMTWMLHINLSFCFLAICDYCEFSCNLSFRGHGKTRPYPRLDIWTHIRLDLDLSMINIAVF